MKTSKMRTKCIGSLLLLACVLTLTFAECNCKEGCARDDVICQECVDGFHGYRCQRPCSHTCKALDGVVACDKDSGRCLNVCIDRYYGDTCQFTCPPRCRRCNSDTNCSVCEDSRRWGNRCEKWCYRMCDGMECNMNGVCDRCYIGYYGDQCDRKCNEVIPDCRQCSRDGQKCLVCRSAKFGEQCDMTCSEHCLECSSALHCSRCEPGYIGNVCDRLCPSGCKECDIQGMCLQCEAWRFGDACEKRCNPECRDPLGEWACGKHGVCYGCTKGFYGKRCEKNCSSSCSNRGGCNKTSGLCDRCSNLNMYGLHCEHSCSSNCVGGCDNTGECYGCPYGYFGKSCDKKCTSTWKCIGSCKTSGECNQCYEGFYGTHCEQNCSLNCEGGCDKNNGACRNCLNGYFGNYICGMECPLNCNGRGCSRFSGNCRSCKAGFYGVRCEQNCNKNCTLEGKGNIRCNKGNGHCKQCAVGYYGNHCEKTCSINCYSREEGKRGNCNLVTGHCNQGCKDGWFGEICQSNCHKNCLESKCNQMDGMCTEGCDDGWFGETCQSNYCKNCLARECNKNNGKCTLGCKDGWFGETCQSKCNETCLEGKCNRTDGMCTLGCEDGWYGETCQSNCGNCLERSCNQKDGICTEGCKDGWFGETCQSKCNETCLEGKCNRTDGMCTLGCEDGWFGEICWSNCSNNCLVRRCNRTDGMCTLGCKDGWFGETCQSKCSENCLEGKCNRTDGMCTLGCEDGWFGEICWSNCSNNCLVRRCNRTDGMCTLGCVSGFIGAGCQEEQKQVGTGESGMGSWEPIAYIVTGCLVVLVIAVSICLYVIRKRRRQASETEASTCGRQEIPLHALESGAGAQKNPALYGTNANEAAVGLQEESSDPNIEVVADLQLYKDRLLSDGRGTPVYEGVFEDSIPVAIKRITLTISEYAEELLEHVKILREVETLRKLPGHNHKNIVRYLKSVKTPHFLYIAFELCQGTLENYVDPQKSWSEELPWQDVLTQMAKGLQFLHITVNMAHRDLKPSNVLLYKSTFDTKVVLADFGQSKMMANMQCSMTGATGSLGWIAPEAEKTQGSYFTDSDIFSLGCLFYYVATKGNHPFGEYPLERQTNISQSKSDLGVLQPYQGCLRELITDMIQVNHEDRPSAELVSQHPSLLADDVIMDFLHKASNKINGYPLSQQNILEDPTIIPGGSWTQLLPVNTQAHLSTYTLPRHKQPMFKGREGSVRHLLRAIRNCSEHFPDLPAAVRAEMGVSTPDHVQFWLGLYPWLLTHVYSNMKSDKSLMDSIRKA